MSRAAGREQRPWGWFEVLHEEPGLKIKRILVKPGRRLSLQSHQHRAENWVIVQGRAQFTLGDCRTRLKAQQSVFIPRRRKHRIHNPGRSDLVFIEVQTGAYLGEDDIVRYQDDFNRL